MPETWVGGVAMGWLLLTVIAVAPVAVAVHIAAEKVRARRAKPAEKLR